MRSVPEVVCSFNELLQSSAQSHGQHDLPILQQGLWKQTFSQSTFREKPFGVKSADKHLVTCTQKIDTKSSNKMRVVIRKLDLKSLAINMQYKCTKSGPVI